jgi:dihydrofolate reductase
MRKLKMFEHTSLDGVSQHSADDGDFPYSDWTTPDRTPAGRDAVLALYGARFDLLLGRRTYDIWSGFWPKAPSGPMSDRLNAAKKYVATHRTLSRGARSRALGRTSSTTFSASRRAAART